MGVAIHTINLIYHIIQRERPIHLETHILTDVYSTKIQTQKHFNGSIKKDKMIQMPDLNILSSVFSACIVYYITCLFL